MRYGHNKWKADTALFLASAFLLLLITSLTSLFGEETRFLQLSRFEIFSVFFVCSFVLFLTYMKDGEQFDVQLTHDKLTGASSYSWMSERHTIDLTKRFKIKSKRNWFFRVDSFCVTQDDKKIYFSSMGLGADNIKDLRNRLLSYSFGA